MNRLMVSSVVTFKKGIFFKGFIVIMYLIFDQIRELTEFITKKNYITWRELIHLRPAPPS